MLEKETREFPDTMRCVTIMMKTIYGSLAKSSVFSSISKLHTFTTHSRALSLVSCSTSVIEKVWTSPFLILSAKMGDFFKKESLLIYFMSSGIVRIFSEANQMRPSHIRNTEGNITFRMEGGETSKVLYCIVLPLRQSGPAGEMLRFRLFRLYEAKLPQ